MLSFTLCHPLRVVGGTMVNVMKIDWSDERHMSAVGDVRIWERPNLL